MTLGYDPALRLYQTVGAATTRFLYDGVDAIAEYNSANALQRRPPRLRMRPAHPRSSLFDPATGQPVLWYEGTGTAATNRRYLSQDERGSVISVSGSTGASLGLNTYDEYGKPGAANLGRYQYTGQKWIGEANVYDYHFRDYVPHLGIFAQTDPVGYGSGPNLYAYVGNDPVNWVDPLGLEDWCGGVWATVCGQRPVPGAIGPGGSSAVNWVEPPSPRQPNEPKDDEGDGAKQKLNGCGSGTRSDIATNNIDDAALSADLGAVAALAVGPAGLPVAGILRGVSAGLSGFSAALKFANGDVQGGVASAVGALTGGGAEVGAKVILRLEGLVGTKVAVAAGATNVFVGQAGITAVCVIGRP